MKKIFQVIFSICLFSHFANAAEPNLLDTVFVDVPAPLEINNAPKKVDGGMIYFIPDSIAGDVQAVLDGKSKIVPDDSKINPNEKVIIDGDTVDMVLKERNFSRYDRGLLNYVFIPKGKWHFGLTASYGGFNSDDLQLLDILADLDFSGHTFSIKPSVSYFIKNNLSVGLRLGYTSSEASLGSMAVDFDEDINFKISDALYRSESYTAAITVRKYIGLARQGRFGVFSEMELAFSSGNGDFNRKYNDQPKNTHTTYTDARLNFSPGLCVFMMENVSFNISFGIFGFYIKNEKQTVDGVESGDRCTSGANFKFNIFNINFGLGVHI